MSITLFPSMDNDGRNYFRVLILDEFEDRAKRLEKTFFSIIWNQTNTPYFSGADIYHIRRPSQLNDFPGSSAFNMVWLNVDFPDAVYLATSFYQENPYCYIACYGSKALHAIRGFLHARPIACVMDVTCAEDIASEMYFVWEQNHPATLRLCTRGAFYDVSLQSLLYCRSVGRKTLFYMDCSPKPEIDRRPLVHEPTKEDVFFAYEQNIKLDDVEKKLSPHGFLRVHQSYLVNRGVIRELNMNKKEWVLPIQGRNGQQESIPVSEKYHSKIKTYFLRPFSETAAKD